MASTSLIFGKTGSGKTTSLGEASLYLYTKTGLSGRGIYSDPGGYKPIQGIMNANIVEPYIITDEPNMPVLLHMLAKGYWPEKLVNGIRPKGAKLLNPANLANKLKEVGFYLYEGLTSSAELLMRYLRERQIPIGGEAVGKFDVTKNVDGDIVTHENAKDWLYCANNMKHYDWVQGEMMVILADFVALPVDKVLMSAHEAQGTDEDSRDPIRGPALVGKAGTGRVGKNVGDCIHYETYVKTVGERAQTSIRAYFQSHPDPKFPNIMYDCKPRLPLSQWDVVDKAFPGGYFDPRLLGKYLEVCDKATLDDTDRIKNLKKEIDKARGVQS